MRFRPCIDIHHGKVKQIVGGTLSDHSGAEENFISDRDAAWYARKYAEDGLQGGHVILLDPAGTSRYEEDRREALAALRAAPGLLQAGGGVNEENAWSYLDAGASHVIVTSYVFHGGIIDEKRLEKMVRCVGREHLVLDLSCRLSREGIYRIVTDRWQHMTDTVLCEATAAKLAEACDEFLVHAADVEGRQKGPEKEVLEILAGIAGKLPARRGCSLNRVTYAGGIRSFSDLELVRDLGKGRLDVTVGSALDLFGGPMPYKEVIAYS